jgi:hypothetical protein
MPVAPGTVQRMPDNFSRCAMIDLHPVGFLNSATCVDLGFYAAGSYSLMRPPRTGWRLVLGQDRPQVPLADGQHPVGDLGPGGEHEPLRESIRLLRGGIFTAWIPAVARTASNESVNCPARSRTRKRKSAAPSPRSMRRLRICWVVHGPSGWAVTPRTRT